MKSKNRIIFIPDIMFSETSVFFFFTHRCLYLKVDREEMGEEGDVTCSKGPPAGI